MKTAGLKFLIEVALVTVIAFLAVNGWAAITSRPDEAGTGPTDIGPIPVVIVSPKPQPEWTPRPDVQREIDRIRQQLETQP